MSVASRERDRAGNSSMINHFISDPFVLLLASCLSILLYDVLRGLHRTGGECRLPGKGKSKSEFCRNRGIILPLADSLLGDMTGCLLHRCGLRNQGRLGGCQWRALRCV
jgi:hypothetical protein